MEDFFIPAFIFGTFFLLFGFLALMRFISYRETLALAEKGLVRPDRLRGGNGKDTLRWGIAIAALGAALCVGLYPLGFIGNSRWLLGLGPWMLAGLLPLFFGLSLILIYIVTREAPKQTQADGSDTLEPRHSYGPGQGDAELPATEAGRVRRE